MRWGFDDEVWFFWGRQGFFACLPDVVRQRRSDLPKILSSFSRKAGLRARGTARLRRVIFQGVRRRPSGWYVWIDDKSRRVLVVLRGRWRWQENKLGRVLKKNLRRLPQRRNATKTL